MPPAPAAPAAVISYVPVTGTCQYWMPLLSEKSVVSASQIVEYADWQALSPGPPLPVAPLGVNVWLVKS